VLVSFEFEKGELISGRRLIGATSQCKSKLLVKFNRLIEVADTNASVEEFDHDAGMNAVVSDSQGTE
jgi:hypothetical protein